MRIFITGAAGFMGSNFIHHILSTRPELQVLNFDKLTYAGNLDNLKDVATDPRYQFVQGDIADAAAVEKTVSEFEPDAIINYAAETHVDRSITDPKAFMVTDIVGTYELLEAARRHHIKKYIQISTDEVYGSIDEGRTAETAPAAPRSPYAASKAGGDHFVLAYHETYGVPAIVTRACNNYGPYHYPEKIIPLFITNLLEGKKVPVYGDGQQIREWIYVEDHCRAVATVLDKGKPGEIYNISTGEQRTNLELTQELLKLLDKDESMIEHVADRPGHDRRYAPDSTKLRQELGWEPLTSFPDGLSKTVEWYKQNTDWWKRIKSGDYKKYYEQQYGKRSA